jgi:hypothetical protein
MKVAVLNLKASQRVLKFETGMTFAVDHFTDTVDGRGKVAHVRDYRYKQSAEQLFQIWSIGPEGYSLVEG